jgi:hypothetical protein
MQPKSSGDEYWYERGHRWNKVVAREAGNENISLLARIDCENRFPTAPTTQAAANKRKAALCLRRSRHLLVTRKRSRDYSSFG